MASIRFAGVAAGVALSYCTHLGLCQSIAAKPEPGPGAVRETATASPVPGATEADRTYIRFIATGAKAGDPTPESCGRVLAVLLPICRPTHIRKAGHGSSLVTSRHGLWSRAARATRSAAASWPSRIGPRTRPSCEVQRCFMPTAMTTGRNPSTSSPTNSATSTFRAATKPKSTLWRRDGSLNANRSTWPVCDPSRPRAPQQGNTGCTGKPVSPLAATRRSLPGSHTTRPQISSTVA